MEIEIWSDVVCPWCYIGKRRFEKALATFPHRDAVRVHWRSFELQPGAAQQYSGTLDEMLAQKYDISLEEAAEMNERVSTLAAEDGLEYHLAQAKRGNTRNAHRLLHLAAERGVQGALAERLMRAYFTEGEPIGDAETLARLAAEVGLDAAEARATLASDDYAAEVRADERRAAMLGIRGVPFVVIDERYGISGAQPTEVFLQALETAWGAAQPLTMASVGATGDAADACADDNCAI